MADFADMMEQWRRLCDAMESEHPGLACQHCPLYEVTNSNGCDGIYAMPKDTDWDMLESEICVWAERNPETVYPTWAEWLISGGLARPRVIPTYNSAGEAVGVKDVVTALQDEAHRPIPADIAEKLGIEPKMERKRR